MTIGGNMKKKMAAGEFKAKCLKVMDEVRKTGIHFIITKRDEPVCEMIPIEKKEKRSSFGWMKGTGHIVGDIVSPIDEEWDANR
jgi:antitoxin (DNA-binding transcriptional repressor) of toxin-antitoxin stability system